eukprot:TRINITY_DN25152_c0_g1_i1.p2 TRINITY_DN25152_c0_g1~~TRINITY_DN25152_c0_g1_i1.p2  ORF type:complete len:131 (-),score=34.41 TRINITY_DN25152_c0_g1_i1:85-477(-)
MPAAYSAFVEDDCFEPLNNEPPSSGNQDSRPSFRRRYGNAFERALFEAGHLSDAIGMSLDEKAIRMKMRRHESKARDKRSYVRRHAQAKLDKYALQLQELRDARHQHLIAAGWKSEPAEPRLTFVGRRPQ